MKCRVLITPDLRICERVKRIARKRKPVYPGLLKHLGLLSEQLEPDVSLVVRCFHSPSKFLSAGRMGLQFGSKLPPTAGVMGVIVGGTLVPKMVLNQPLMHTDEH